MTTESIEARIHELMAMQKIDIARALAEIEAAQAPSPKAIFASPAPVMEQGTDPEIIDVAPASTEPEVLEPLPTKVEYTGGPLTDAQAVAVFQGEEQPSVETDVGWHMATPDAMLPNAAIEGADAAPADQPAQDAQQ